MPYLKIKKAFTLIELLIVISVIGILVAFVIANFSGAQNKSRDARRKTDLDALKKALELMKSDSTGSSWFPNCTTGTTCNIAAAADLTPNITSTYIKQIPKDPSSAIGYLYKPTGCGAPGQCADYFIVACLQNGNDPQRDPTKDASCTSASTPASYTITNP